METKKIFADTGDYSPPTLIERLDSSAGSKRRSRHFDSKFMVFEGIAFLIVWTLIVSFGVTVWYWLFSGASAYLALMK